MADQPGVYVMRLHACHACGGRRWNGVPDTFCSTCAGQGVVETRLPLADGIRSDPETRAALRGFLAEVCGELADSGFAPGVWLGAAKVLGAAEEEGG
jgi:hypothetical protein